MTDPRRHLPGVDALLESSSFAEVLGEYPRGRVVAAVRTALDEARGDPGSLPADPDDVADPRGWAARVRTVLVEADRPSLQPALNATGVVLHTNLGRAPLPAAARKAVEAATAGYTNLEFDLQGGGRGSRYDHCADLLAELTGAEAGLVVNNCAAGLLLSLTALARDRATVISRGELVEIGGGFRIPEILERAGTRLREVGSTNRTRPPDYRAALDEDVAVLLKVHRSNFRIRGFTEEAALDDLVVLAAESGLPLLYDLGSGLLDDPDALGLPPEPRPADGIAAGADLVLFSGDKLLGGPQAGLVVGRADLVARLRSDPLCRALRVDKATLAALEATLRLYRDPQTARAGIPVLRMLSTPVEALKARAWTLVERLEGAGASGVRAAPGEGAVGGGTYPEVTLASWTLRLDPEASAGRSADDLARALRTGAPAVVARIDEGEVVLDLRTVPPSQDDDLLTSLLTLLNPEHG